MKFCVLNLSKIALFMCLIAGVAFANEAPISLASDKVVETGDAEMPETVSEYQNFAKLVRDLGQFNSDFLALKPRILKQEDGYIFIGETPEEALKEPAKSKRILKKTKDWVGKTKHSYDARVRKLDRKVLAAHSYCDYQYTPKREQQCANIHDAIHSYEARVSIYMGMMAVMQKRYAEAKAVLYP